MIRQAQHFKCLSQEGQIAGKTIQAKLDDFNQTWRIFKEVISTGDTLVFDPNTTQSVFESFWYGPDMHTYVYENEEGEVVGTYRIKPNQPDLGSHIANAGYMVLKKQQGKGIGRKLCEHSLKVGKQLGFHAMQFNIVVSSNEAAVNLYKKLGFSTIGTIPEAFKNLKLGKLIDAHIMYRKL